MDVGRMGTGVGGETAEGLDWVEGVEDKSRVMSRISSNNAVIVASGDSLSSAGIADVTVGAGLSPVQAAAATSIATPNSAVVRLAFSVFRRNTSRPIVMKFKWVQV